MSTPKYKKIYDKIVHLILTNQWAVGSNMKSENELIKLFGASRLTIRNVLSILENEGRILRSRGKATLILDRLLQNSKETEIKDRSETLNADYKLLDLQIIKNSFTKLFTNSSSLYYINRVRRIKNNEVYLISRAYIPTEINGKAINKNFFKDKNLLHLFMSKLKIKMKKSEQEVSAISLSKNDSVMFRVNEGYPAVLNCWYFYDYSNKLVLIDQETTIKALKVKNYYK
ncbi:MAG: GntR family transcriptional regulator [Alphaproteobacteria bacterium]|nr:GntR family transcriptional regulator [Alphaproteobacteria bacterium]